MTLETLAFEKLSAIFPVNELYFLAQQELIMQELNRKLERTIAARRYAFEAFPLTRLISRKAQQDGGKNAPFWQGNEKILPWEEASYCDVLNYRINYDSLKPQHANWDLQETARRNRHRKIKAVFIDHLVLTVKGALFENDAEQATSHFTFECTPIPKKSLDTLRAVRSLVSQYSERYQVYPNFKQMSKKDRAFFGKIYVHPSCLELKRIQHTPKECFPVQDITDKILNATNYKDQAIFWKLSKASAYQIIVPHKKYDRIDGFIFDGVLSPAKIEAMLHD